MRGREGNGENELERRKTTSGQKRLVGINNLRLFYSLLSMAKLSLSEFLKFQNGKTSRAKYSVFGELPVKRLGNITFKIAQVRRTFLIFCRT